MMFFYQIWEEPDPKKIVLRVPNMIYKNLFYLFLQFLGVFIRIRIQSGLFAYPDSDSRKKVLSGSGINPDLKHYVRVYCQKNALKLTGKARDNLTFYIWYPGMWQLGFFCGIPMQIRGFKTEASYILRVPLENVNKLFIMENKTRFSGFKLLWLWLWKGS